MANLTGLAILKIVSDNRDPPALDTQYYLRCRCTVVALVRGSCPGGRRCKHRHCHGEKTDKRHRKNLVRSFHDTSYKGVNEIGYLRYSAQHIPFRQKRT